MALFFKDRLGYYEWHVGEPTPELQGRVITFHADGHELEMILAAMRCSAPGFGAKQVAQALHDSLASTHVDGCKFHTAPITPAVDPHLMVAKALGLTDAAEDGPEVAILSVDRETPPKFTLVGAVKDLIAAARCFSFNLSPLVADDNGVGSITGTHIAAGEVRRLNAALAKFDE